MVDTPTELLTTTARLELQLVLVEKLLHLMDQLTVKTGRVHMQETTHTVLQQQLLVVAVRTTTYSLT
jgi:hypothetical protein